MSHGDQDGDLEIELVEELDLVDFEESSGLLDLTDLVEEAPDDLGEGGEAPPRLVDDQGSLWPAHSGLHSTMLSTAGPTSGAEAWLMLVEELAEESRLTEDEGLRGAMQCEAGRILIDRLGRKEEGELLLARSGSPIAEVLRAQVEGGLSSLAAELAALEQAGRDTTNDDDERAASWIEFGQLCEERTSNLRRAYEAYREALRLSPHHPIALGLATDAATFLGDPVAGQKLLRELIPQVSSSRMRAALLLDLAELTEDPDERLIVLEQAHQAEPREETALRRLSRALSASGDHETLGQLYRELAAVAEDPISASTALHLAFLSLARSDDSVDELVLELANRADDSDDGAAVLAPLAEVALHVEQRIAAGEDPKGLPENLGVLERLSRSLDDPREQALVREQLARIRLQQLRADDQPSDSPSPGDTSTGLRKLSEDRASLCERLEADLRFCLVHLPEHRWVCEALAEVLDYQHNLPALVLHLEEWARTQSAGPGRATILLRLGRVHEHSRRDLPRAAEIYELAVAEDPDNPDCLRALGGIYEKMRRWPQAVANLRRQIDETHDEYERLAALRRLATMAEHELGDVDLSIASLEKVARDDPEDILALYQLAKLSRAHRRPAVLITALQLLVDRVQDEIARTAALVELGEVLELHLKKRRDARDCYERALQLTPGYTPALRALARLYRDNGELPSLVELFSPTKDPITDPAVLAYKAGRIYFEEVGDVDKGIEKLEEAYQTNPDLAPARELLLQLLTARHRIEEAYDLLRAQDLPNSAPLQADHHYRLGLLAEAIARQHHRETGIRPGAGKDGLHPANDAALQHYRAALAAQPDHGLAFERSRRLLVAHHDVDNLVRLVEALLENGGDDAIAVHLVQLARMALGTSEGIPAARRSYEDAMQAAPDDALVRRQLESMLRLVGDHKSLPALYLRTARHSDDTHLKATLLVEAAELLLTTGAREDHDLAGKAILEALHEDPGNPYAVRHLERLLSEPESPFVIKDAVSARAVRAQSDAERAIFYVESAELLERVGAWGQARRAYLAAKGALPDLAPADLGLARTASDKRRSTTAVRAPTSIHVLVAEARDAMVRAARGDATARERALKIIAEILQRDTQNRDAIALARTLAGQAGDAGPVIELLTTAFPRLTDPDLRYELALFLGEHAVAQDVAVRYYDAAAKAKPDGRRALRGLVNAYRKMGDDRRAAEATERLLQLFDPTEPSAIDLRMGIASFLAADPQTLPRAIDHARIVLQARGDDPRALLLMSDLLQRADRRPEAAELLDRLAARERNRDRLHDIYLRKAKLLADVPGAEAAGLEAVERAAAINPGNRETISLLVDQLNRTGQSARVAAYLQPIRNALVANVSRGAVSLRDLGLLATVSRRAQPDLARMASDLLQAMEPSPTTIAIDPSRAATRSGLRRVLETASLRVALYSAGEPPLLHSLLQSLDSVVARLSREFPVVNNTDAVPIPPSADVARLTAFAERCAALVGAAPPKLGATASPGAVVYLAEPVPTLRLGTGLWQQGDAAALEGLVAMAMARFCLGAPRARALSPMAMDLLLAAAFEAVGVFNPMTADPDPRRLKELAGHLAKALPPRQRRALERQCQGLANHAFDATSRAIQSTDLHVAALLTGTPGSVLSAACLLDGSSAGGLKQRINRSRTAQELLAHLLGDPFLAAQTTALQDDE
ncbi:tetratricopeptide repeat protein [Paraliomyxa miuraensis]|uniref:tetratricopeptide repeat protein n=1 Tax=Paraliomyxa miuraensis TaxID=376150 RepID=UPI00224E417B|nr:tetratricopeptide repeat protein [Paraliomyxa miuraensis]MCX4245821.1 tetratricopeptide repeat protein [Paraliomyxa miuraensis]